MKHKQPSFYRIISKSFETKTMSHAYLLVGETSLLSSAYWLSALIMSNSMDEKKIEAMIDKLKTVQMVDFSFIDGSVGTIKKEVVSELQASFQNTALEENDQKIALIHQIHKATPAALNSLLKFLEEPSGQTTSFVLTTDNIELVLPTILSRCVVVHLQKNEKAHFDVSHQHEAVGHHLLATVSSEEEALALLENKNYQEASNIVIDLMSNLKTNPEVSIVNWQLATKGDREITQYVIQIVLEHLKALLYNKTKSSPFSLKEMSGLISIFTHMNNHFNPSTNIALLVDEASYSLLEVLHGRTI